jgi:hypothetical protein
MPKFITIGYGDREGYDRTPTAVRDAAHSHDAKLRAGRGFDGDSWLTSAGAQP